jgi:hypothetical protein
MEATAGWKYLTIVKQRDWGMQKENRCFEAIPNWIAVMI